MECHNYLHYGYLPRGSFSVTLLVEKFYCKISLFYYFELYACIFIGTCTWGCLCWQRPRVLDVTRDEVTGFCETPDVVLGIEFWSSGRAEPAVNCWATSPSQSLSLFISMSQNSICQLVEAKWSTVRWMNVRLQSWEGKIIIILEFFSKNSDLS